MNTRQRRPQILLASMVLFPLAVQAAPTVLFCKGECFVVDEKGARRPAPKGAELRPGERFETGPDSYAQLRLGPDADVGVSERARVRFDQTTFRDRDVIILDQGRIRTLSGEALGKPAGKGLELRTVDGIFAVKGADVEAKRLDAAGGGQALTYVKPNAGNVLLRNGTGNVPLGSQDVQGVTGGKLVTGQTFPLNEVALANAGRAAPAAGSRKGQDVEVAPVATLPPVKSLPPVANVSAFNQPFAANSPAANTLNQLSIGNPTPGKPSSVTLQGQVAVDPLLWQTAGSIAAKNTPAAAAASPAADNNTGSSQGVTGSAASNVSTITTQTNFNSQVINRGNQLGNARQLNCVPGKTC